MFPFDPPENIRKLLLLFSRGSKGNIEKKRLNKVKAQSILYHHVKVVCNRWHIRCFSFCILPSLKLEPQETRKFKLIVNFPKITLIDCFLLICFLLMHNLNQNIDLKSTNRGPLIWLNRSRRCSVKKDVLNFAKFLRTPFLLNTSRRLLLTKVITPN